MRKIETVFTYEELQDNTHPNYIETKLFLRLLYYGYEDASGPFIRSDSPHNKNVRFVYYPTYRDILFQKFKRWVPEWKKKKEILLRRFK